MICVPISGHTKRILCLGNLETVALNGKVQWCCPVSIRGFDMCSVFDENLKCIEREANAEFWIWMMRSDHFDEFEAFVKNCSVQSCPSITVASVDIGTSI